MYIQPTAPQPPVPQQRQPSRNTGLDITAFVLSFFFPFIGFILGWVAISSAHRENRRAAGLSVAAMWIGGIATVVIIVVVIAIAVAAANDANSTQTYMNCVNNALNNGTDPSVCQP